MLVRYLLHLYAYPNIVIAACPKTASTWLAYTLADALPGFEVYQPPTTTNAPQDLTHEKVKHLRMRLSVTRLHTPCTPENLASLVQLKRYVVLVRDLRDVIVSIYWHIQQEADTRIFVDTVPMSLPWERITPAEATLEKEACIDALIEKTSPGLARYCLDWWRYAEDPSSNGALLLRYEDLISAPSDHIANIASFFELRTTGNRIADAVNKPLVPGQRKFRRGEVGAWKEDLLPGQIARCETIGREFLQVAGYAAPSL